MTWAPTHGCALALLLPKRATKGSSKSTPSTLARLLKPGGTNELRRHASAAWSLCDEDPERIAEWCLQRWEKGLFETEAEEKYLRQVIGSAHAVLDAGVRGFRKSLTRTENQIHQDYLKAEKARVQAWDERRQLMAEREEKRRQASSHEAIRQRVAAAPKPAVLTLHRQRLERTLKATSAPEPMTIAPTKPRKPRSPMKGECGQRIGRKIDRLLEEIRHEAECESTCCAAPVAVMEKPEESTVDPPEVVVTGGGDEGQAPVEPAAGGGTSGFPTYTPDQVKEQGMNLWSLVAGHESSIASGVAESIATIQTDGITAAARLKALSELQAVLRSTSAGLDWESPVCVPAGDLVLVMQMAMQRLG